MLNAIELVIERPSVFEHVIAVVVDCILANILALLVRLGGDERVMRRADAPNDFFKLFLLLSLTISA